MPTKTQRKTDGRARLLLAALVAFVIVVAAVAAVLLSTGPTGQQAATSERPYVGGDGPRSNDDGRRVGMTHARGMMETNPSGAAVDADILVECIEACFDCAQSCTACADACFGEDDPKSLARCIRLNLDCADVCDTTGRILSRQTAFEPQMARAALQACAEACRLCGEECEQHASHHEHCRVCAEACRRCESACNNVLSAIPA